jgi:hypothetical protein
MANEVKKQKRVRLDLINKHAEFVKIVQQECSVRSYDRKKVEERLNCHGDQAKSLILLAQLADAKGGK